MSDDDPDDWGPSEIPHRVNLIFEGKAYDGDVHKLLEVFCSQTKEPGQPLDEHLLGYVVSAFSDYLNGDAPTLDHAFGLRQRGRPRSRTAVDRQERIACAVATQMLCHGKGLDEATAIVKEQYGVSESHARDLYVEHKDLAVAAAKIAKLFLSGSD